MTAAAPPAIPMQLPAMVLVFGIAANRSLRAAAVGVAGVAVAITAHDLLWEDAIASGPLISSTALCAMAAAFGWAWRAAAGGGERERVLLAERAAAEERLRIARELHDAVGHDVSLIVVQAQALGATAGDAAVREATERIADLGRRAMDEMHRTLQAPPRRPPAPSARAAARPRGARRGPRRRARGGRADHDRGRGRAAPAGAGARRLGVPDRAGGGDERRPPRGRRARDA